MKRITEDKAIITGIVIVFLLAAAHNYDALRHFAIGAGVAPRLAWTTPGFIDLFIGVAVWVTLRNKRYAEPARLGWAIVIIFTFVSFVLNMMHYPQTAGGVAMALIVPSVVFCAAELGKGLAESAQRRQAVTRSLAELSAERDKLTAQVERLEMTKTTLQRDHFQQNRRSVQELNDARQAKIDNRRADVLAMLQAGMSHGDVKEAAAEKWNVQPRTIGRDIKALNGAARR